MKPFKSEDVYPIFLGSVNKYQNCWKSIQLAYHLFNVKGDWYCLFLRAVLSPEPRPFWDNKKLDIRSEHHIIIREYRDINQLNHLLQEVNKDEILLNGIKCRMGGTSQDKGKIVQEKTWEFSNLARPNASTHWPIMHPSQAFSLVGESGWNPNSNDFPNHSNYDEINEALLIAEPCWDGIDDIAHEIFGIENYRYRGSRDSVFVFIAPLPITLLDQFGWEPDRTLVTNLQLGEGIDLTRCELIYFGKGNNKIGHRFKIVDNNSEGILKEKKQFQVKKPVGDATFIKVVLLYNGIKIDEAEVFVPSSGHGSPSQMLFATFDENLNNFEKYLLEPGEKSKHFEAAFEWLLSFNGFIAGPSDCLGLNHAPDVLAYSIHPPILMIIQCTTAVGPIITKIQDVSRQVTQVLQGLPFEAWTKQAGQWTPRPAVFGIIATPLPEINLQIVQDEGKKLGIKIIGQETLKRWLNYAYEHASPKRIFDDLRK
jgi:hypothetical protein